MVQKLLVLSISFAIDYTPHTLQKCGAPNFEKLYKINNWLHCGERWAQLNLKFSPYPTNKKSNHIGATLEPPTSLRRRESETKNGLLGT